LLKPPARAPPTPDAAAPDSSDPSRLVDILVTVLPPAAAVLAAITNVVNLWLAERIVKISGRLRRPSSDLPSMHFPPYAPALVGAAVVASLLPGIVGTSAGVLAAS